MKTLILAMGLLTGAVLFTACAPASAPSDVKKAMVHCPMHPTYTSDRPGECPICHMSLVPIEPAAPAADGAPAMADRAEVFVPADKEQWIGVRTAPVETRDLELWVRASARVSHDPDLFAALAEHREVLATRERDGARAEELLRSSRLRLAQFGLTEGQMDRMARAGGAGLLAGTGPGLVYVQAYEDEAGVVKPGQSVDLTSPALPGETLRGRVESLDRVVDPATRTLRARVRVAAGAERLRPEMFLEAVLHVSLGKRRVLPKEAVIDTGLRRLVYVKTAPGHYRPREVTLGREGEDAFEVLAGVADGDEVVASAQFLIDSESRLKAVVGPATGGHAHD